MLCTQINNVLCYFMRRHPITKLKLLISYCYSFYGSVLWGLSSLHIEEFCRTWRKGLRRALDIPADTHNRFLHIIASTLPILDELVKRTANFIQRCMSSDNVTVSSVTNMAVFSLRMTSPIGRNAFYCCSRYNIPLDDINRINRQFISRFVDSDIDVDTMTRTSMIYELLQVKSYGLILTTPEFSEADLSTMIEYLCR